MKSGYPRQTRRNLRKRWEGQDERIQAIIADARSDRDWTRNLMPSKARKWRQLPGLDTCPPRFKLLQHAAPRDLRGITLSGVDLADVTGFADTCLDLSILKGVSLDSASLTGASLRCAEVRDDCVLDRVKLQFADLRCADLRGASLEGADLTKADIRGTDLRDACLIGTELADIVFDEEPWWGFLAPRVVRRWTRLGGKFQSPSDFASPISLPLAHFIGGENIRWLSQERNSAIGRVRYLATDYGRSPGRLLFWVLAIWLLFGIAYAGYPLPPLLQGTWLGSALCWLSPRIHWQVERPPGFDFRPFYASAMTMTSLEFPNIAWALGDWKAQVYASVQSAAAYVLLAMLVSVLMQDMTYDLAAAGPALGAHRPRPIKTIGSPGELGTSEEAERRGVLHSPPD
jgi:hypothetical protein